MGSSRWPAVDNRDSRRPHGLISDEQLQERITAAAAKPAALAKLVEVEQRRERQQAERAAAARRAVGAGDSAADRHHRAHRVVISLAGPPSVAVACSRPR
ncbi:hypothetical protein [Streptosporangium canum]|uniref:hypothetical protein n=1 Tax=Streptosporangium canum TaxID=324952 RepID=UPI0037902A80